MVNCVDLPYFNYECFVIAGGGYDVATYNIAKKTKGKVYVPYSGYSSATTALRVSPDVKFLAIAQGSDWSKGLDELSNWRRAKILVIALKNEDNVSHTSK